MSDMIFLIADVLVLGTLVVAIFFCVRLSGHLKNFRNMRSEFQLQVAELNKNISRAEKAVSKIKNYTEDADHKTLKRQQKLEGVYQDLEMLVRSAEKLSEKLENGIEGVKKNEMSHFGQKSKKTEPEMMEVSHDPQLFGAIERMEQAFEVGELEEDVPMKDFGGFMIQDKEFPRSKDYGLEESVYKPSGVSAVMTKERDVSRAGQDTKVKSKAERDLMEALSRSRSSRLN